MSFWQSFAVAYPIALALILAWNHGAHRKPSPRRSQPTNACLPARGSLYLVTNDDGTAPQRGPAMHP